MNVLVDRGAPHRLPRIMGDQAPTAGTPGVVAPDLPGFRRSERSKPSKMKRLYRTRSDLRTGAFWGPTLTKGNTFVA